MALTFNAGCPVGLLTYLALPIDSWFTGDRGTLFILAWGLTKKKTGNIPKAGKNPNNSRPQQAE